MGLTAYAQVNLVRNGSFEELKWPDSEFPCPTSGGAIGQTKYWNSAWGSVDYFNVCSNEDWPLWGVPSNALGVQRPYEGLAYAGLATYSEVFAEAREFLWQELEQALRPGQQYYFSMQLSLMDSAEWATNSIGVLFTQEDPRFWADVNSYFISSPQIQYQSVQMTDKVGWMEVHGTFVAQGGELYLTIGNFIADDDPLLFPMRVDTFPDQPNNWEFSAYYIDAISLYEIGHVGLDNIKTPDITVFPNPSDQEMRILHAGRQGQLTLREITGRTVSKSATSIESTVVGTSDLGEGIYILEFFSDTGTKWQFHVVVQHR